MCREMSLSACLGTLVCVYYSGAKGRATGVTLKLRGGGYSTRTPIIKLMLFFPEVSVEFGA